MTYHDTTDATVHDIRWSTCVEDRTAIDATVRFADGGEVDVTLLPAQDGRYRWEAWGDVTCWLSEPDAIHPDDWHELEAIVHFAAVAAGFEPIRVERVYVGYTRDEGGLIRQCDHPVSDIDSGALEVVGEPEALLGWPTPYMRQLVEADGTWTGYIGCDEHGAPVQRQAAR